MLNFLTTYLDLYTASVSGVLTASATNIACTPADVITGAVVQNYPIEKVYKMRQVYTKSSAVVHGSYIKIGGANVTYAVQSVLPFAAQGGMDAYTEVLIEEVV